MVSIKTNFSSDSKLVMINEYKKIIAIINVPKKSNIADSVMRAIKDELQANQVIIQYDIEIGEFDYAKEIRFIYSDDYEYEFMGVFELIKTEEY